MTEFIILVLFISLFLYAYLAGADFGAGILQLLPIGIDRDKKSKFIGKAMGPVWEANHIWLILALVITFNGFPNLFWFFSEWFHFPLGALAFGIIFRGASFTFLHYDPIKDKAEKVYHWIFGVSSIWCTFWIGIIVGSLMLGNFSLLDQDIYPRYFAHWLNPVAISMGLFTTALMMFNAALFLYLESKEETKTWLKITSYCLVLTVASGLIVHLTFFFTNPNRWRIFFFNPASFILIFISGILLIPQYRLIKMGFKKISRGLSGFQLALIMAAGFAPLYPKVMLFRNETFVTFHQMAAEPKVMNVLGVTLILGCLLILPSYFYLLKIFKSEGPLSQRE